MEIISIEKRFFDSMLSRLETTANKIDSLSEGNKDKRLKDWLDNQDVCMILSIDKRTLQNYRDKKILPYSQFVHKNYYKPEDVERVLQSMEYNKK